MHQPTPKPQLRTFPVIEEKALRLAQCYNDWLAAKGESAVPSPAAIRLEQQVKDAKDSLFLQAKPANLELFPALSNSGFSINSDGETINPERTFEPGEMQQRQRGEKTLKNLLNNYVAGLAKEQNLTVPTNNDYYGIGQFIGY